MSRAGYDAREAKYPNRNKRPARQRYYDSVGNFSEEPTVVEDIQKNERRQHPKRVVGERHPEIEGYGGQQRAGDAAARAGDAEGEANRAGNVQKPKQYRI